MKFTTAAGLLASASLTHAFPTAAIREAMLENPELSTRADEILRRTDTGPANAAQAVFELVPTFNAKAQYIDVSPSGPHKFVPPGPHDARGPCPGLNAFANHNFLPHDGYATIQQFIDVTTEVVGMGVGLAGFLAVFGAAIDGSGTAWSIGGTPYAQGKAGGNGISNSHNKYEGDASPTRPDLYQYGNDYDVIISQYQELANLDPAPSNFDISTLTKFRSNRFDKQVASNPNFFNGPFTGVAVQPAAYTFIFRFMSNHSAAHPEGILNRKVFQSWFSITGSDNNYKWVPGYEQIPQYWYRRPIEYPYEQDYFVADVIAAGKLYPKFFNVGGNNGKTGNSFIGVDFANLTGGTITNSNILKGANAMCLAYQFAAQTKPDIALNAGLTKLQNKVSAFNSEFGCPKLQKKDTAQLKQFPGYTRSGSPQG